MWSKRGTEIHEYRGVQTPHHVQNFAWPAERFLAMFIRKAGQKTWRTTQTTMRRYKYAIYKKCSFRLMF
jgi:AMMECR1 domain-containing protein